MAERCNRRLGSESSANRRRRRCEVVAVRSTKFRFDRLTVTFFSGVLTPFHGLILLACFADTDRANGKKPAYLARQLSLKNRAPQARSHRTQ